MTLLAELTTAERWSCITGVLVILTVSMWNLVRKDLTGGGDFED